MMSEIYKGDIGTKIRLNAGVDLSLASSVQIKYRKPNGTEGYWAGTVESLYYASYTTTAVTDLDVAGKWEVQLYISGLGSWTGYGGISSFYVMETVLSEDDFQGYCNVEDVQRFVKRVQFVSGGNSKVTLEDVLSFITDRYYQINSALSNAGITVPVQVSAKVSHRLLRRLNAIGAAADAESVPSLSVEKESQLSVQYNKLFNEVLASYVANPKLLYDAQQVESRLRSSTEGLDEATVAFPQSQVDNFIIEHRLVYDGTSYAING